MAAKTFIGNNQVKKVFVGNNEVKKIYVGNNLVYQNAPETQYWSFAAYPSSPGLLGEDTAPFDISGYKYIDLEVVFGSGETFDWTASLEYSEIHTQLAGAGGMSLQDIKIFNIPFSFNGSNLFRFWIDFGDMHVWADPATVYLTFKTTI